MAMCELDLQITKIVYLTKDATLDNLAFLNAQL